MWKLELGFSPHNTYRLYLVCNIKIYTFYVTTNTFWTSSYLIQSSSIYKIHRTRPRVFFEVKHCQLCKKLDSCVKLIIDLKVSCNCDLARICYESVAMHLSIAAISGLVFVPTYLALLYTYIHINIMKKINVNKKKNHFLIEWRVRKQ